MRHVGWAGTGATIRIGRGGLSANVHRSGLGGGSRTRSSVALAGGRGAGAQRAAAEGVRK